MLPALQEVASSCCVWSPLPAALSVWWVHACEYAGVHAHASACACAFEGQSRISDVTVDLTALRQRSLTELEAYHFG